MYRVKIIYFGEGASEYLVESGEDLIRLISITYKSTKVRDRIFKTFVRSGYAKYEGRLITFEVYPEEGEVIKLEGEINVNV